MREPAWYHGPMSSGLKDLQIASRLVFKSGLPVSLIFFVTGRCNLLCTHCFYWEQLNKNKNELTTQEIETITRSLPNLLTVSLTGGEPYLRPDLAEIAHLFEKNSGVRNIQIPSNGFSIEKTVSGAESVLNRVKTARICTGVSLDGPPEIHNAIRQNPRSFSRAIETLDALKKLKPRFPNLSVGVALTVSAANQDRLMDFYRYVEEELQPDAVTITLVRGTPLDPTLKNVDMQVYREFARKVVIYRKDHLRTRRWSDRLVVAKEAETYRLIEEAATTDLRISPCYAGQLIGILSETGEVYLCETLDRKMGNVRDYGCDFAALWSSEAAASAVQYQQKLGCQCTYECAMSVNTLFNPSRALRIFRNSFF